jgi:hypothetical protein
MKIANLRLYFVLVLALAVVGVACNDDPEEDDPQKSPSLVFSSENGAVSANTTRLSGENVSFKVAINKGVDGKKLKKVTISVSSPNVSGGVYIPIPAQFISPTLTGSALNDYNDVSNSSKYGIIDPNADGYTPTILPYTVTGDTGQVIKFKFRAEDTDGNGSERIIEVRITGIPAAPPTTPISFTRVLTGGPTSNSMTSLTDSSGIVFTPTDASAQSSSDIYFFYSSTSGSANNIVSPAWSSDNRLSTYVTTLTGGNATTFKSTTLTQTQFDNLVDQSLLDGYYVNGNLEEIVGWSNVSPTPAAGSRINNTFTTTGKVLAFQVTGGRSGLLFIESAASSVGGNMTIKVKVERP